MYEKDTGKQPTKNPTEKHLSLSLSLSLHIYILHAALTGTAFNFSLLRRRCSVHATSMHAHRAKMAALELLQKRSCPEWGKLMKRKCFCSPSASNTDRNQWKAMLRTHAKIRRCISGTGLKINTVVTSFFLLQDFLFFFRRKSLGCREIGSIDISFYSVLNFGGNRCTCSGLPANGIASVHHAGIDTLYSFLIGLIYLIRVTQLHTISFTCVQRRKNSHHS